MWSTFHEASASLSSSQDAVQVSIVMTGNVFADSLCELKLLRPARLRQMHSLTPSETVCYKSDNDCHLCVRSTASQLDTTK